MMRGASSGRWFERGVVAVPIGLLLVLSVLVPATGALHEGKPVVLELTGDEGDAWAIAVRSHDEPTSYLGNEIVVGIWGNAPYESSISSRGLLELHENEHGEMTTRKGVIGTSIRGGDEMQIEPVGDDLGAPEVDQLEAGPPAEEEGTLGWMKYRQSMEPGEWRYFLVWAGGSETSTFQLLGEGFTVEKVVHGDAHVLGNDELITDGGIHAHKHEQIPPGTPAGGGHVGAGVTAVSDTGVTLETQAPLMGLFTEYHLWAPCTAAQLSGCTHLGGDLDSAAERVQDGGFANISIETPLEDHIWNRWNFYSLDSEPDGVGVYDGKTPGTYRFHVNDMMTASGPSYREPVQGQGAWLDGEQLVLSMAEVDYPQLEGLEDEG